MNIVYVDQPVQTGYSYDTLTNVTLNMKVDISARRGIIPTDFSQTEVPKQNETFLVGTMSSQNTSRTVNTTQQAAAVMWYWAQGFFEAFPHYQRDSVSLYAESYGGHYGPIMTKFFLDQNERIINNRSNGRILHIDTLGLISGCIDASNLYKSYVEFAHNNTYGIRIFNESYHQYATHELDRIGGILEKLHKCKTIAQALDPLGFGTNEDVNRVCANASNWAEKVTDAPYTQTGRASRFDVTAKLLDPFPPPYLYGWLNQAETQRALGVPVNHTWESRAVSDAFTATGDNARGGTLEDLAYLLDQGGVRVALIHGDRDFACNWIGGEQNSLDIPWSSQQAFAEAGYAPISLGYPYTYPAGLTRQYGNLSFTRVYQGGHMLSAYQPEISWTLLMRTIRGRDLPTGRMDIERYKVSEASNSSRNDCGRQQYGTCGPPDTWWMKSDRLEQPPGQCYSAYVADTRCTQEEMGWLSDGSAILEDWTLRGHLQPLS